MIPLKIPHMLRCIRAESLKLKVVDWLAGIDMGHEVNLIGTGVGKGSCLFLCILFKL